MQPRSYFHFFFFNDTATTEIYTLSLHDALPISGGQQPRHPPRRVPPHAPDRAGVREHADQDADDVARPGDRDRKSTRLNSSHGYISYAVFCLKKKKKKYTILYVDCSLG